MKMNIPCRVLKMVKRYAITMEESLRKSRPKDQVSPSRQRRTNAPDTHDLQNTEDGDERVQRRTSLRLLAKTGSPKRVFTGPQYTRCCFVLLIFQEFLEETG